MAGKAQVIFEVAFDPMSLRTPRSIEYMEGARAALENAEHASDAVFILRRCPYDQATAAFDAWHAGAEEGRRLWRINNWAYDDMTNTYDEFVNHTKESSHGQ